MGSGNSTARYPKLKRPATYDFLAAKPKPWRIVEIHGDIEAVKALEQAEKALGDGELAKYADDAAREAALAPLRAAVDECREQVVKSTRQLLVQAVGREHKEKIRLAHPPTDESHREAEAIGTKAEWEPKGYSIALIAASLVEPKLSEEELHALTEQWTDGEFLVLWMAVLEVNSDSSLVALGKRV